MVRRGFGRSVCRGGRLRELAPLLGGRATDFVATQLLREGGALPDGQLGGRSRGHRVAARIKSGTVGINMPYSAFPGIPFGGYKQSGFGRELGIETLELYLETKSVLVSTSPKPFNPFGL